MRGSAHLPTRSGTIAMVVFVVAAAMLVSMPAGHAEEPCGNGRRGFSEATDGMLVPGLMPGEDAAFNGADPDAVETPLIPIRFPDEVGLWAAHRGGGSSVVVAVASASQPEPALPLGGLARLDRSSSDSIVRMYCGLFGREPDAFDLQYWTGRYGNGLPLTSIATAFTGSAEFIRRFGIPDDAGLVPILFREVLRRDPGPNGMATLVQRVRSKQLTRGELIVAFTDSPEYVRVTGTVAPEKPLLPYPHVGSGRRIIYTNGGQRIWLVEASGELTKTHQVSGRRGVPAVGRYRVYSKSRHAWAPYDGITMEYMVRFARGEWPYGFHSIPVYADKRPLQRKEQLGSHLSGGCVRQDFDDAEFVFEWADVGTRVIVIP